jgi:hypothetical protein
MYERRACREDEARGRPNWPRAPHANDSCDRMVLLLARKWLLPSPVQPPPGSSVGTQHAQAGVSNHPTIPPRFEMTGQGVALKVLGQGRGAVDDARRGRHHRPRRRDGGGDRSRLPALTLGSVHRAQDHVGVPQRCPRECLSSCRGIAEDEARSKERRCKGQQASDAHDDWAPAGVHLSGLTDGEPLDFPRRRSTVLRNRGVPRELAGELKHGFGRDPEPGARATLPVWVGSNSLHRERSHGTPSFQGMTTQGAGRLARTKGPVAATRRLQSFVKRYGLSAKGLPRKQPSSSSITAGRT